MNFKILTVKQLNENQIAEIAEKIIELKPIYFSINQSSFVFLDNTIIGIFQIINLNEKEVDLRYGIFKDFQNKKIGAYVLNHIINYIFLTNSIKKVYLNIDYKNLASIKVAENCNLKIDYNLVEIRELSGEGDNFIPYFIENKKLEKDKIYDFSLLTKKF